LCTNKVDPKFKEEDEDFQVISRLKKPKAQRNRGVSMTSTPPRMTRSRTTRLVGESTQPQRTIEKEVIVDTPPKKKCSKTLGEKIIVGEHSVEHIELHGDPEIVKIFEEIQSSSLPTNESLGEKLVDELIGVDNSAGNDKRIGRSKRKIREMTFVDDFIRNQNILLKDYSV
jgi:hypothetical protein